MADVQNGLATVEAPEVETYSKQMVREATRLDEKIKKSAARWERDTVELGGMFAEMQDNGYHRALGFGQFGDYIKARFDRSPTVINQSMRIYRQLTAGEHPIATPDDVREMGSTNAEALTKLKAAGQAITPELIDKAKSMPVVQFRDEVVMPLLPPKQQVAEKIRIEKQEAVLTPAEGTLMVRRSFNLTGEIAKQLAKAIEIASWLTRAHESDANFDSRVVEVIVAEFLSTYEADFAEIMKDNTAKAKSAAKMTEERLKDEDTEEEPAEDEELDESDEETEDEEEPAEKVEAAESQPEDESQDSGQSEADQSQERR